jgi:F0F1-type ATP synthase membrane subunit b/b'
MVVAAGFAVVLFFVVVLVWGYWPKIKAWRERKREKEARQAEKGETRADVLCQWSVEGHPNLPALSLD